MKTKLKQNKKLNTRLIIKITGGLLIVAALLVALKVMVLQRYINAANQAEMVSTRSMILNAVDGLKVDAPIDAKTGDTYFPQARLFLPNGATIEPTASRLTYRYDMGDKENKPSLSISSRVVLYQSIAALYQAKNIEEVFSDLPKLQSCQRGVDVVYNKINDREKILKGTVRLNNNRTAYLYMEKSCPELNDVVNVLKKLQAY